MLNGCQSVSTVNKADNTGVLRELTKPKQGRKKTLNRSVEPKGNCRGGDNSVCDSEQNISQ